MTSGRRLAATVAALHALLTPEHAPARDGQSVP
jgi:hypothetical protein